MRVMPRYRKPSSPFGERLVAVRKARGLSQVQLARLISATQRAISYYEVEATFPPAEAIVKLARALRVSTDELLGLKRLREEDKDQDEQRLWRKFRQIRLLPEKDQRAIARMVNSLVAARGNGNGSR
jgi:transcriptional regulator with XRE-family HTH domain